MRMHIIIDIIAVVFFMVFLLFSRVNCQMEQIVAILSQFFALVNSLRKFISKNSKKTNIYAETMIFQ